MTNLEVRDLINKTIATVGRHNFLEYMDILGWRGDYENNTEDFLMNRIANSDDDFDVSEMVISDMIYILNVFGYDFDNNNIIEIEVAY